MRVADVSRWSGESGEVVDTERFEAHAWNLISQLPRSVLCAVIRNPENLSASASLRVVRNSVAHDDDVSELIPEFLLAQGRGFGVPGLLRVSEST